MINLESLTELGMKLAHWLISQRLVAEYAAQFDNYITHPLDSVREDGGGEAQEERSRLTAILRRFLCR